MFEILIVVLVVIAFFFYGKREVKNAEKNMDENNFVVRRPKIFLVGVIIFTLAFSALLVYMTVFPDDTMEWWHYLFYSLFVVVGLFLIVFCATWELRIEGNKIVHTPFIGIKRDFAISNITKVKKHSNKKISVYAENKKLFSVEFISVGYNVLVSRLKREQIHFE
ncbi:MAG: hypothetical protein FWD87_01205 [Spirochaetaceae bacterium]|nr:hypothetical protein [Spirochaetaceae bacterium]